jgi:hypothetical protein
MFRVPRTQKSYQGGTRSREAMGAIPIAIAQCYDSSVSNAVQEIGLIADFMSRVR